MQRIENGPSSLTAMIQQIVAEAVSSLAEHLDQMPEQLKRIADHFDKTEPEVVGTRYLADKLGQSTQWIAQEIRDGKIPKGCIAGGGDGRQWKFYRKKIDEWLESQSTSSD